MSNVVQNRAQLAGASPIRGYCPSLTSPIATGDGLLARLRLVDGEVTPQGLAGLAAASRDHGNGRVEITSRGSLQVRGLRAETAEAFAKSAASCVSVETGIPVETPALAGVDAATQPLLDFAQAVRNEIADLAGLVPAKASVVIDDGTLRGISADIRIMWPVNRVPNAAIASVRHRLAQLMGVTRAPKVMPRTSFEAPVGLIQVGGRTVLAIILPAGGIEADALSALCDLSDAYAVQALRLGHGRRLYLLDAEAVPVQDVAALGLIVDVEDPRADIAACAGGRGCAAGHFDVPALAERIARDLPQGSLRGRKLVISGCAKRCPATAQPLEIVGTADDLRLFDSGSMVGSAADAEDLMALLVHHAMARP